MVFLYICKFLFKKFVEIKIVLKCIMYFVTFIIKKSRISNISTSLKMAFPLRSRRCEILPTSLMNPEPCFQIIILIRINKIVSGPLAMNNFSSGNKLCLNHDAI